MTRQYRQGLELYKNGKYSAAQQYFRQLPAKDHAGENSDQFQTVNFIPAMCAVNFSTTMQKAGSSDFLGKNPENPLRNEAMFNLAGYFYQRKSYNNALDLL